MYVAHTHKHLMDFDLEENISVLQTKNEILILAMCIYILSLKLTTIK